MGSGMGLLCVGYSSTRAGNEPSLIVSTPLRSASITFQNPLLAHSCSTRRRAAYSIALLRLIPILIQEKRDETNTHDWRRGRTTAGNRPGMVARSAACSEY